MKYKYKIRSEDEYIDDSIEDIRDQVVFIKTMIEFLHWRVERTYDYRVKLAERRKEDEEKTN